MKETEMYDDELRGALRTMAEREEFDPIEPGPVLRRGRRGVRLRRLATGAGAGLAVAAVATAAVVLATPGGTGGDSIAVAPMARLAGAGAGDAALVPISQQEMLRRCRVQWSAIAGHDVGVLRAGPSIRPLAGMHGRDGRRPDAWQYWPGTVERVRDAQEKAFACMVPGDSVPSATDLAEDARGAVPADDAGLLQRCSTMFWHDLRGWRVLGRQVEPDVGASIAAMSPSGRYVLNCFVSGPELRRDLMGGTWHKSRISGVQKPPKSMRHYDLSTSDGTYILAPAVQTCDRNGIPCVGWFFFDTGRMPLNVVRLEARTTDGRTTEIPVRDGWFAAAFSHRSSPGVTGGGTLTGFDSAGRRVGSIQFFPMPR